MVPGSFGFGESVFAMMATLAPSLAALVSPIVPECDGESNASASTSHDHGLSLEVSSFGKEVVPSLEVVFGQVRIDELDSVH